MNDTVKTYDHSERCQNCGKNNYLSIPKGITIFEFLKTAKCFVCGCIMGKIDSLYNNKKSFL